MVFFINAIRWLRRYGVAISGVLLALTTGLSLMPLPELPAVPGSDKTHHLIAYAAVAVPTALAGPRYWLGLLLGYWGWSGAIELIQPLVNRYGEWLDLLANGGGLLIGSLVGWWLRRWL